MLKLDVNLSDKYAIIEAIKLLNYSIGGQAQHDIHIGWDALPTGIDLVFDFDMLSGNYTLTIDESSDKIGHNFDSIEDNPDEYYYHKLIRNALASWI